jgi:hypothetical protein
MGFIYAIKYIYIYIYIYILISLVENSEIPQSDRLIVRRPENCDFSEMCLPGVEIVPIPCCRSILHATRGSQLPRNAKPVFSLIFYVFLMLHVFSGDLICPKFPPT